MTITMYDLGRKLTKLIEASATDRSVKHESSSEADIKEIGALRAMISLLPDTEANRDHLQISINRYEKELKKISIRVDI